MKAKWLRKKGAFAPLTLSTQDVVVPVKGVVASCTCGQLEDPAWGMEFMQGGGQVLHRVSLGARSHKVWEEMERGPFALT